MVLGTVGQATVIVSDVPIAPMKGPGIMLRSGGSTIRLASGTIGLLGALNDTIGQLEVLTVILISLVIFGVTTFIYRSFTAGLLLTVISNTAYLITSALMYYLEIGLDVNTLPIGAVGMGIGIDYNIYLMSRMCE